MARLRDNARLLNLLEGWDLRQIDEVPQLNRIGPDSDPVYWLMLKLPSGWARADADAASRASPISPARLGRTLRPRGVIAGSRPAELPEGLPGDVCLQEVELRVRG